MKNKYYIMTHVDISPASLLRNITGAGAFVNKERHIRHSEWCDNQPVRHRSSVSRLSNLAARASLSCFSLKPFPRSLSLSNMPPSSSMSPPLGSLVSIPRYIAVRPSGGSSAAAAAMLTAARLLGPKRQLMRFHRLRGLDPAGDGGVAKEVSGSGSGVAAEDDDRDDDRDGAVGRWRAEATSVRQIWMRSCFAGGIRGLTLIRGSVIPPMVDYEFVQTCNKVSMFLSRAKTSLLSLSFVEIGGWSEEAGL
jgi:hypothetical protein